MLLGPSYAKAMQLGWQPFALSLIASEMADEYPFHGEIDRVVG